jgi:gluconolactonase
MKAKSAARSTSFTNTPMTTGTATGHRTIWCIATGDAHIDEIITPRNRRRGRMSGAGAPARQGRWGCVFCAPRGGCKRPADAASEGDRMMSKNPIDGYRIDPAEIRYIGEGLQRPECILAERDGTLWAADARGGVVRIDAEGGQSIVTQSYDRHFDAAADDTTRFTEGTLPNGLAFAANGDILISNFGTDCLETMTRDGATKVLYDSIDGAPIGKVNFVLRDSKGRIWLTVSTRLTNWMEAIRPDIADGYIALADDKGLRIVADGFRFTNEIRMDAAEAFLYVVETCGPCISRLRVGDDGTLSGREIFGPSSLDGLPDGIAFDAYGNLWGTLVMADRIFAITPDGDLRILLDDGDAAAAAALMAAFERGAATPELMLAAGGTIAPWFASVTFGGADLRTAYIGSLRGSRIPYFRAPVAGLAMAHWD